MNEAVETIVSHHGCGDELCACSWAQVIVRGPHTFYPGLFTSVVLDEGHFATDGESIPEADIVALAAKWGISIGERGPVVRGSRPAKPDECARYQKAVDDHRASYTKEHGEFRR